ncbi:MAG: prohibitin family protein [Trueperaceae bacterium]|nr:prohibitin family protein [Trueperaceae bacterium]
MTLFVLVGLAIVVGGVALIVQGIQGNQGRLRNIGGGLVAAGAVIAVLSASFVVIPAGNRGVVFNVFGGVQDSELGEGVHIILPLLQQVTVYDIRQQELTLARETNDQITARSSEGLEIIVDVTVLYQIAPSEVSRIHQDIGPSYESVRVRPEIRSQIRDGISEFNAASLISTERSELQQRIESNLVEGLSADNILVLSVLLRDVSIPESITRAIEEKQAAEQQIEVEENRLQQAEVSAQRRVVEAEGERDAQIARAQGEAEALSLRGQAIRENPEIIQLEAVERLSPSIQTIMLPTESNFLLDVRSLTQGVQSAPAQSGSQ